MTLRSESKDREMVQRRLREHVLDPTRLPLLIFPEGTCVNNEYCVMFKRGRAWQIVPVTSPNAFEPSFLLVERHGIP